MVETSAEGLSNAGRSLLMKPSSRKENNIVDTRSSRGQESQLIALFNESCPRQGPGTTSHAVERNDDLAASTPRRPAADAQTNSRSRQRGDEFSSDDKVVPAAPRLSMADGPCGGSSWRGNPPLLLTPRRAHLRAVDGNANATATSSPPGDEMKTCQLSAESSTENPPGQGLDLTDEIFSSFPRPTPQSCVNFPCRERDRFDEEDDSTDSAPDFFAKRYPYTPSSFYFSFLVFAGGMQTRF